MKIVSEKRGSITVVTMEGRLDAAHTPAFESAEERLIAHNEWNIVVDGRGLEYVGSVGLKALLKWGKQVKKQSGKLRFACLNPHVQQLFEIAGLPAFFPCFPTLEEALEENKGNS
ncbi:MAG: STAS domain-containing protein [Puniceicoccales bacterium]|jgi:anti-anti-sigma factor|nr:STAS domain-containing protein [Puniceicoccales bacterium]